MLPMRGADSRARRPLSLLGLVAGLTTVLLSFSGVAIATPAGGVTTTNIVQGGSFPPLDIDTHVGAHKVQLRTKGASDLWVVSNVFAPGGQTGWHTHPGPSLITVKSGSITAYSADDPTCTGVVYSAGEGFVDEGDGSVHLLRNEGTVAAETVAVQLLPDGAVRRIDAPDPGHCPF